MKLYCKALVLAAVFVTGLLMLPTVSAGELEKWIPGDAVLYGKVSGKVIRESALFNRLLRKYPDFKQYIQSGREHIGNYQGDLDAMVFTFSPEVPGSALFMEFSKPYSQDALAAGLSAKGLEGKYEKITVAGKNGYVLTKSTPHGRSCFVMLSDRVMLGCLENAAEAVLAASPISGDLLKKLQGSAGSDVFLQIFPAESEILQGAGVQKFEAVGRLPADASLKLNVRVQFADEFAAQNAEQQIQQGMMLALGLAFADDAALGMEVVSRVRIKREGANLIVKCTMPADLMERLVNYTCDQVKKREQQKAKRARRQAKQGNPAAR